mgnify:CR=1 FL=1
MALLEVQDIQVYYGMIQALKGVSFSVNEGEVIGMGTHRELLKSCSIYYDIASSQLTEEELA